MMTRPGLHTKTGSARAGERKVVLAELGTPTGWSVPEREAWAAEVLDTKKVLLHCGVHKYVASDTPPPPVGCKNCWEAYWWYKIASTPPHLRLKRLEEAMKMVRDANQAIEEGNWDFKLDEGYAKATIEKDGLDDETGEYRRPSLILTDS